MVGSEMILPKLPDGYCYGFLFSIAAGKRLDVFGKREQLPRKRWWFMKEPDYMYKRRIALSALQSLMRGRG